MLHTDECLRYAAKTGKPFCIAPCADARNRTGLNACAICEGHTPQTFALVHLDCIQPRIQQMDAEDGRLTVRQQGG